MGLFDDYLSPGGSGTSTISPGHRDLAIRTIYGEAGNEPDEGQAAVAAVIRNRVQAGRYGGSDIPGVVLAKNQFEPWGNTEARGRMSALKPDDPRYQKIGGIVDQVFGGQMPDPTNGATHFFSPTAQAALGRNVPAWAQGEGQPIGRHTFFAPEGRVQATDISAQSRQPKSTGLFDDYLSPMTTSPQATRPPAEALPADTGGRFSDTAGESFRAAREGISETAPPKTGALEATARGAATGVTANFYDELRGLMEAGGLNPSDPASLSALMQGAYKYWTGDPEAAKRYEQGAGRERDLTKRAETDQPVASIAGNIAGGIALPLGAAARGASLADRTTQGARVGAAIGGLSGVGAGDDTTSRVAGGATGTAAGAVIGAAAPAAIEGVVRGARNIATPIANTVRGIRDPEGEAARRTTLAIQRDIGADPQAAARLTPAEFAASVQSGGPATLMDIGGETTRALARSAANTSPEGRALLNTKINERFEGQTGRVTKWLDETFNYPDAHAQQQAIEQVAKTVNKPAYARAYRDGDQPIWSPELQRLVGSPDVVEAMRNAAEKGKSRAIVEGMGGFNSSVQISPTGVVEFTRGKNGVPTYPNLQFWDYTKRALDDQAKSLARTGRDSEAGVVKQLAHQLRSELDAAVPSFAQARAGAAYFFGAENALEAGQKFVMANFQNSAVRQQLGKMSPTERQLFQDGFVSRYIETLNKVGDRRSILNQVADNPAAREKLNIVLGPQKSAELEAGLRAEGIMDFARKAVQGNSTTARQLTELGLAGGTYGIGTGFDVMNPNPSALMSAALVYGAARGRTKINEGLSRKVAEMLVSNDPRLLLKGVKIVSRNQNMLNSLRSFDKAVARSGSQQSPGAPALQSMGIGRAEDDQPQVQGP